MEYSVPVNNNTDLSIHRLNKSKDSLHISKSKNILLLITKNNVKAVKNHSFSIWF